MAKIMLILGLLLFLMSCGGRNVKGPVGGSDASIKKESSEEREADKAEGKKPKSTKKGLALGDLDDRSVKKMDDGYVKESARTVAKPEVSGLKAGYADDNKQFNYFVDFLKKYRSKVSAYNLPIEEKVLINVRDEAGKVIPNALVEVYAGKKLLEKGVTYADGSYLFFPSEYDPKIEKFFALVKYKNITETVPIDRQGKRVLELKIQRQRDSQEKIPLDMVFILDTTGSLGEEIHRLKTTIEIINMNLTSLSSKVDIRFGMVQYKDREDSYVTKVIPLTRDLQKFQQELNKVTADGGGDTPEDLQSALEDTIKKIEWNKDGIRLGFIITDAPPHLDYGQQYNYVNAAKDAKSMGIKLFSIGTGGLDLMGEYVLRQISQYTYAKYIFLTYGEKGESEGGRPGSVSHHTGANFQTDKLEAIIIRFAKEELAFAANKPLEEGQAYIQAVKISDEEREETLKKLFKAAASQLVDFSSIQLPDKIPTSVVPFALADKKLAAASEYFTEQMIFSLQGNVKFKLVERKDLQKILSEMKLQSSDLLDEKSTVKLGKLLGAQMLISGKLYAREKGYELFIKLLRVETGEILAVTKLLIAKDLGL